MSACACDSSGLMPVDEAIARLLACAPTAPASESLALADALGRVLAEPVLAPRAMPPWDNSAMDGYAFRAADLPAEGGWLPIAGRIAAGDPASEELTAGTAVRIFTGAPLPPGADTVVAQEQARVEGGRVWLPATALGSHVRRQGEEFQAGARLLASGQRLRPQELGLLASLGRVRVRVYRRLRIGLLSSGNELCQPGESLRFGQIYDANRFILSALLTGLGFEVGQAGILGDHRAESREALRRAAADWDVLVSSGGVSVGEEDHLKAAVEELGELHLWRLAIQPGKPLAFGQVCGKPWFGLPGNPVAALLTGMLLARPFLLKAQGQTEVLPRGLPVKAGFAWSKANARRQYLRVRLESRGDGVYACPLPNQGSAMLTSACAAEGLALVECGRCLEVGETVDFISFGELCH